MSAGKLLTIEDLHVSYGKIAALRGVDLAVEAGEAVAIVGANGAGKSTLLRTISGLHRPTRGRIVFDGADIAGARPYRVVSAGIVQVPEGRMVLKKMTVMENLLAGAHTRRDGRVDSDIERILDLFPALNERLDDSAGALSGGQQQMLVLGRALIARPQLLMLDEPSLGLAPLLVDQVFEIIAGLREEGQTVLLVEQNARKALAVSDRGYVMELGRIATEGKSDALADDAEVVRSYLGGSAAAGNSG